jgi:hypothetical protein
MHNGRHAGTPGTRVLSRCHLRPSHGPISHRNTNRGTRALSTERLQDNSPTSQHPTTDNTTQRRSPGRIDTRRQHPTPSDFDNRRADRPCDEVDCPEVAA